MKEISSLDELKEIELSIMKKIHKFCCDNDIVYYLAYGTLLGAVRHQGFIPWDDDIDIWMPRKDYVKFCKLFPSYQNQLGLTLVNNETKPKYARPMSKVIDNRTLVIEPAYRKDDPIGVFVDIWPIDGIENDYKKRTLRRKSSAKYVSVLLYCNKRIKFCDGFLRKLLSFLFMGLHRDRLINKIEKISSEVEFGSTDYVFACTDNNKCYYMNDWFSEPTLAKFEDAEFFVPNNSDDILTARYGNWRELPPESQRIPHHIMNTYWKEQ